MEDYAVVVPVPVVLSPASFVAGDGDPCNVQVKATFSMAAGATIAKRTRRPPRRGVTVEVELQVREHDVVIVRADDATSLLAWLREGGYKLPRGAESRLALYVRTRARFLVARIDPAKVQRDGRRAVVSPLAFHYDPGARPRPRTPPAESSDLMREVGLLRDAHEVLRRSDPAEHALALLDEHRAAFPAGHLSPEATVLRVEALVRIGDRCRAGDLAYELLASERPSVYEARLQRLVGTIP